MVFGKLQICNVVFPTTPFDNLYRVMRPILFCKNHFTSSSILAELEITIGWPFLKKQEHCYRLSMASPLEMYSKDGLANWISLAKW